MKNIIAKIFATICLLTMATISSSAQTTISLNYESVSTLSKDTIAEIVQFSAKSNSGKIYLHWNVINQHLDGLYFIFRSEDGENFELAGNKKGVGVPISKEIAYYFIDECGCDGKLYYKIIHLGENQSSLSSRTISVENTGVSMSSNY
jgi:hypothetical protein